MTQEEKITFLKDRLNLVLNKVGDRLVVIGALEDLLERESSSSIISTSLKPQEVFNLWNNLVTNIPKIRILDEITKRNIRKAGKIIHNENGWVKIITFCNTDSFYSGQDTSWRSSFRWLMKPGNLLKIYDLVNDETKPSPADDWRKDYE